MKTKAGKTEIESMEGDITQLDTEAIVNAAGPSLVMGGGVAGAILKAGGEVIKEECNKIGKVKAGEAVITTAGRLKAKHVIHAVGPRLGEGDEENKLRLATSNSLILADKYRLKSIAFPAISTGIFGFPKDRAAKVMLSATIEYLKGETQLERVIFCLYGKDTYEVFCNELEKLTG
ncbi:MAG: hypothetical protein AMJ45_02820 [Syntrophobacter sp. DG_60]|nr:MAG: hypothetical protein AMJ45_02820 [Syntrophobacter sp. DG_60]